METKENNAQSLALVNAEIKKQLADPAVLRTLLATTFKGLDENTMRQAILEGHIRGFTFKQFLEGDVYAIPFGKGYSLVTSIDYSRKIGMKSGVIGKSAPVFTYVDDTNTNLESCSITIKRRVGQDIAEYTATVYFDEYSTGRNLWSSKPRTMLAKVAESHALRMACPEELAKAYTEEELDKEKDTQLTTTTVVRTQEPFEQEDKPNLLIHQSKRGEVDEDLADELEAKSK